MKTTKGKQRAWFYAEETAVLFVGFSGNTYPSCYELVEIPDWLTLGGPVLRSMGVDLVMSHLDPYYRNETLERKGVVTVNHKEIW
jgi:hypothetical protein